MSVCNKHECETLLQVSSIIYPTYKQTTRSTLFQRTSINLLQRWECGDVLLVIMYIINTLKQHADFLNKKQWEVEPNFHPVLQLPLSVVDVVRWLWFDGSMELTAYGNNNRIGEIRKEKRRRITNPLSWTIHQRT